MSRQRKMGGGGGEKKTKWGGGGGGGGMEVHVTPLPCGNLFTLSKCNQEHI